jgi:hypothetical protein
VTLEQKLIIYTLSFPDVASDPKIPAPRGGVFFSLVRAFAAEKAHKIDGVTIIE